MRQIGLFLTIILAIISSGCLTEEPGTTPFVGDVNMPDGSDEAVNSDQSSDADDAGKNINNSKKSIETMSFNGIDNFREIKSDQRVELTINGLDSKYEILNGTDVKKIFLNGENITVYLPPNSNPEINDNGIDNKITYRKE